MIACDPAGCHCLTHPPSPGDTGRAGVATGCGGGEATIGMRAPRRGRGGDRRGSHPGAIQRR
eukprot:6179493-Pleurochrysis_carterae.AAC.2